MIDSSRSDGDTTGLIRVALYPYERTNSSSPSRRLAGNDGYGTHYVSILVGNPGQPRTLAVSTNSDYTAFPCTGCFDCGNSKKGPFDYGASSSFESVPCGKCFNEKEACDDKRATCSVSDVDRDMSGWDAFEAMDMVQIGKSKKNGFPLMFGCQTAVRGRYETEEADGIMGMSPKRTSFIYQMYKAKVLPRPAFSLCFGHKVLSQQNDDGSSKGALTLGGYDPKYHMSPIVFATNTQQKDASFSLYLSNMYLRVGGGQTVEPDVPNLKAIPVQFDASKINDGLGVALDSGSPFTLFTSQLDQPFKDAWREATGENFSYKKFKLTQTQLFQLPTILLQFKAHFPNGKNPYKKNLDPNTVPGMVGTALDYTAPFDVLVAFPASHYMEYNANIDRYRPRISFNNADGGSVLGANMMQGHDITFDVAEGRIGFAESLSCEHAVPRSDKDGPGDPTNPEPVSFTDDDLFNGEVKDIQNRNFGDDDDFYDDDYARTFGRAKRKRYKGEVGVDALSRDGPASCLTMTCKAFVGMGYFVVAMAAWVIYKCVNLKSEIVSDHFGDADNEEVQELTNIDFPDYEPEEDEYDS